MSDQRKAEDSRAAREALDATAKRAQNDAVQAALKRYLASEQYREQPGRKKDESKPEH